MYKTILLVLLARHHPLVKYPHWGHNSSSQPTRNRPLRLFVSCKHFHLRTITIKIYLDQFSLKSIRCCSKARTSTHKLNIWNQLFSLIRLAFLETLTDQVMYAFETFLIFFWEVDFWSHKQFLSKDDFVFVREFKGCFIRKLIVRNSFVSVLKKMAVLMFEFSHDILNQLKSTMYPQIFIFSDRTCWFTKLFL